MLMKISLTSQREPQGRVVQREGERTYMAGGGDWTQIYVTKQKESHNVGLLAEVYTSELGAVYMEDPSWLAWHNSTVPTREREREMASGLGTGTRPLRGRGGAKEKGREWKTQPHPGAPCLGQRTVVEARPLPLPRPQPATHASFLFNVRLE